MNEKNRAVVLADLLLAELVAVDLGPTAAAILPLLDQLVKLRIASNTINYKRSYWN